MFPNLVTKAATFLQGFPICHFSKNRRQVRVKLLKFHPTSPIEASPLGKPAPPTKGEPAPPSWSPTKGKAAPPTKGNEYPAQ